MRDAQKPQLADERVAEWLSTYHRKPLVGFSPLSGGFWSAAYAYQIGGEDLVLRLSESRAGFDIDRRAMQFKTERLPIPDVLDVGEALGRYFAVSRRLQGTFLEEAPLQQADAVGRAVAGLLSAMRSASAAADIVKWYSADQKSEMTWADWLRSALADKADAPGSGWRGRLAEDVESDQLFTRCQQRIIELLPYCPERRDLIHGDLLHENVLVSADACRVTGVFSWKCSAMGDFLYDVAWCTLWGNWHPVIASSGIWGRTINAPDLEPEDLADAELRHHCYELQIAASHMGWYVWTEDRTNLDRLKKVIRQILSRGPLQNTRG